MKHYLTKYTADGKHYACSWLQVGKHCFAIKTIEL